MRKVLVGVVVGVAVLVGAGALYVWISGGSGQPSAPITAPPLSTSVSESLTGTSTFDISPAESVASFEIEEQLRGEPNQVVGTTSEVAGQIVVDLSNAANSQVGKIVVNARTFQTDNGFRDSAIRGPILQSSDDQFEFIRFVPIAIEDLSGSVAVGSELTFTITGDLTIVETTKSVAFDVTATLVSPERLEGIAVGRVLRSDFGIGIPNVPNVAGVSDEVTLTLAFVALAA